ncbi:serine/threonine-protein kinase [Saccharothrix sp. Mg75]|uniref:serine/threonine-protein kinase n=1 Tax=Saccharothrix sp. Mg75 TaxID=3445357 RepID=UPI003EE84138
MSNGQLTGEVVDGRYALGALYGTGGTAEVYQAFDTELERRVAIKLFRGTATREDGIRLGREVDVSARLWCPGMVAVHDTGSFRGRAFFVMQAVEGGTLRRRMREPPPPASESVARIGVQVAEVLAHLHRHDVVHRDVKPSNILLDRDDQRAYLADFGLVLQSQATRVTRSGFVVGTPAYLAPEQVRGGEVTSSVDVFALGLVLLECLTGQPGYLGGDTESALARLHRGPLIPDDLPGPWRDTLTAMTSLSARRRPTAADCAERLAAMAHPSSSSARPPDVERIVVAEPPVAPRGARRHLLRAGAAAVLTAATALLVVLDSTDVLFVEDNGQPDIGTSVGPTTSTSMADPPQPPVASSTTVTRKARGSAAVTATPTDAETRTTRLPSQTAQQHLHVARQPPQTLVIHPESSTRPAVPRTAVGALPRAGAAPRNRVARTVG